MISTHTHGRMEAGCHRRLFSHKLWTHQRHRLQRVRYWDWTGESACGTGFFFARQRWQLAVTVGTVVVVKKTPTFLTTGRFTGWEPRRKPWHVLTRRLFRRHFSDTFFEKLSAPIHRWKRSCYLKKNGWHLIWIDSSSYNNRKLWQHRGRQLTLGQAWSTRWHMFTQTSLSAIIRNRNYLSGSHLSPTASFMDFPISVLAICACFSPSALAPKATSWIPLLTVALLEFLSMVQSLLNGIFVVVVVVRGVLPWCFILTFAEPVHKSETEP